MKTFLQIQAGKLTIASAAESTIRLLSLPDEVEKNDLVVHVGIDRYDVDSALDPDEISRVEFGSEYTYIIWKVPYRVVSGGSAFEVNSMGFFLSEKSGLTIIGNQTPDSFLQAGFQSMNSLNGLILRYFAYTTRQFLAHLKAIKQTTAELEAQLISSMTNQSLLKMFDLGEQLVFYLNAIEANGLVLEKLRNHTDRFQLSDRQKGFIEDIILDNKQCARQAQIYTTLLTGLMDARGNIINNNMNVLLKNLTIVNVVFLPLSIISGMGGMSEFSMILELYHIPWQLGYSLFLVTLTTLGLIGWKLIMRFIDNR